MRSSSQSSAMVLWAVVVCLVPAAPAQGHDLGVIRGDLVEIAAARYTFDLELAPGLEPLPLLAYPSHCRMASEPTIRQQRTETLLSVELDCGAESLGDGDAIGLLWPSDGAFVRARWLDTSEAGRFFEGGDEGVVLDVGRLRRVERPVAETAWHYSRFGVEHILSGWDHLAFVLGLFLIARGWTLAGRVTAFTVGHSLSLMLSVLGLVNLPGPPVEACIALSIAFIAREALTKSESTGDSQHSGWGLVFAFGLLHGLGFAGALTEGGIEGSELVLGLLTFNLGVEIGQLLFVAMLMMAVALVSHIPARAFVGRGVAYAVGILGIFWTLERLVVISTSAFLA